MTQWTVARQAPLSMGFSRQEYWGGLPLPSPGDLCDPGIKPMSPALQVDFLPSESPGKPNVDEVSFNGFKRVYPCDCSNSVSQGRENRRTSPLSR